MIKVSVMYPNSPGVRFEHNYYRDKHLPLIKSRMGAALQYYTIDKGRAGGAPDAPAAYVAMCHLLCDSAEAYKASFGPYAQEISGTSAISPIRRRSYKSVRSWSRTRPKASKTTGGKPWMTF